MGGIRWQLALDHRSDRGLEVEGDDLAGVIHNQAVYRFVESVAVVRSRGIGAVPDARGTLEIFVQITAKLVEVVGPVIIPDPQVRADVGLGFFEREPQLFEIILSLRRARAGP